MIVTRDEILDAIDRIQTDEATGLCTAFRSSRICDFLGVLMLPTERWHVCWYWPVTYEGREQRLMFLAFLLTWHDEIMEGRG
jgi:hypothetical protein